MSDPAIGKFWKICVGVFSITVYMHLLNVLGETRQVWDIFHICCNSSEPTWDSFLDFCIKKGNYKYFNSSPTFCFYIRYMLSRKLFLGPVPILPDSKMLGKIGTVCAEEWDMHGEIKISIYLKLK